MVMCSLYLFRVVKTAGHTLHLDDATLPMVVDELCCPTLCPLSLFLDG